ncbi:MAG: protein kinase [bacterium]
MDDLTGKIVDKYELIRLLGEGGMGAVYEARHTFVKKPCAVKILHSQFSKDETVVKRMLREAQAAAAVGHPNIVEMHDFGLTDDGICYLVMELLSGENLSSMIQRFGHLGVEQAVAITIQVLSSLSAAHNKNIVHRDLKPENVFIAQASLGEEAVKLLDFGISKYAPAEAENPRLTRTGTVMGTPYYMSPEQAAGAKDVDKRTDLWSVGVILYECLTGQLPYQGDNYNEIIVAIVTKPVRPPIELNALIPEALNDVVMRALHRKIESRFRTATEMIGALVPFYDRARSEAGRYLLQSQFLETAPGLRSGLSEVRRAAASGGEPATAQPEESDSSSPRMSRRAAELAASAPTLAAEESFEVDEAARTDEGAARESATEGSGDVEGAERVSQRDPLRGTTPYGVKAATVAPTAEPEAARPKAAGTVAKGREDATPAGAVEPAAESAASEAADEKQAHRAASPDDVGNVTVAPGQVVGRDSVLGLRSRSKRPAVVVGAVLGAVVLGLGLWYALQGGKRPSAESSRKRSSAGGPSSLSGSGAETRRLAPVPMMRPMEVERGGEKELVIGLEGLVAKAAVRLDGKIVTPPLRLTADGRLHRVTVVAAGYRTFHTTFRAEPTVTSLAVRMKRRRSMRQGMLEDPRPRVMTPPVRPRTVMVRPRRPAVRKTMDGVYKSPFD